MIRKGLAALALAFVLAHLPYLPDSLEDIDSVNFALGVRDFDVAKHRPHPPGYPAYIVFAKAAVGAGGLFDTSAESRSLLEARALALLSLASAVVAIVLLYRVFTCLPRSAGDRLTPPWKAFDVKAMAATALAVACPLFWYLSVRPLSDVPGFAAALASQACLALAWWRQQPDATGDRRLAAAALGASGQMIVLGSLLAAVAIGFRLQNALLTLPLLFAVLVDRIGRGVAAAMVGASVAGTIGTAVWAIPLVMASGGLNQYLGALGGQAGEDFAGVQMLYLNPSPRLAATILQRTFIHPWDSLVLGVVVTALAAIGVIGLLLRDRRALTALIMLGGPYLAFHVLFQDVLFVRYALPVVPPVAYLAVCGLELVARRAALPATGALALWGVAIASPPLAAYGAEPSPTVRALREMERQAPEGGRVVIAMHQTFERPLEAEIVPFTHRLPSPPRREWLELARYWREGNETPLWFLADPRRSDLALIDPASRNDRRDFAWRVSSVSQFGGLRPAGVAWYRLGSPGWFAEEGWALTPETAGIAREMQRGPHLAPISAWVRRRADLVRLLIGGRHLGVQTDPPVAFTVAIDGKTVAAWNAGAGFFLHVFDLPAGTLSGDGRLAKLEVRSASADRTPVPTAIEQFDLQSAGALMWGFDQGWHEAEYDPRMGLWRWTSERAALRIVDASGPAAIRLHVESPLRYFDEAPAVRLKAGEKVLAETRIAESRVWEVVVPLEALTRSGGLVTIETDRTFVPAETGRSPDPRRLGLRIFGVDVRVPN